MKLPMLKQIKHLIADSRQAFLENDIDPHGLPFIRDIVADSWVRSKEYGVDPYKQLDGPEYQGKTFELLKRNYALLLKTAKPYLRRLASIIGNSDYMIALYTPNGVLLELMCSESLLSFTAALNIMPGAVFSEETVGTCANGLCSVLGQPVWIRGSEHYSECLLGSTCAAAPIKGEHGQILGIITMESVLTEHQYGMTLGWVSTFAWAIENNLKTRLSLDHLSAQNNLLLDALRSNSGACMALDKDGLVLFADDNLASLLNKKQSQLTGVYLEDLFSREELLSAVFKSTTTKHMNIPSSSGDPLEVKIYHTSNNEYGVFAYLFFKQQNETMIHYSDEPLRKSSLHIYNELFELINTKQYVDCLLRGEIGTGKHFLAKRVFSSSHLPYIEINSEHTSEKELLLQLQNIFQQGKSGATNARYSADRSMPLAVIIENIESLPLAAQQLLLNAFKQRSSVNSLPGHTLRHNAWLLFATTSFSEQEIKDTIQTGSFSEELWSYITTYEFVLAPLKSQASEIALLTNYFLQRFCSTQEVSDMRISNEALSLLRQYRWPKNVFQLRKVINYAASITEDGVIKAKDLPSFVYGDQPDQQGMFISPDLTLEEIEKQAINHAIKEGNLATAAQTLGIGRTTLYRKIKKYQLEGD